MVVERFLSSHSRVCMDKAFEFCRFASKLESRVCVNLKFFRNARLNVTSALKLKSDSSTQDIPSEISKKSSSRTFIIGVAGGTASGKTSVCSQIMEQLKEFNQGYLVSLTQDSFYRNLTPEESEHVEEYNFDHPDAFDFPELLQVMKQLKRGQSVEIPHYDYVTNARLPETTTIANARVVLLEGILVFHSPEIRDLFDMKIFVDTDADTRLARRIKRDIVDRGRDVMQVINRYEKTVKPSFENYVWPTKQFADIIVPRGVENTVAIRLIVQHIRSLLKKAAKEEEELALSQQ